MSARWARRAAPYPSGPSRPPPRLRRIRFRFRAATLRIAVPKGSLEGTVRALEAASFNASAFVDAGRHLIVGAPDRAAAGTRATWEPSSS